MAVSGPAKEDKAETVEEVPVTARVVHTTPGRTRTIFDGLVKDARKYVEQNFPRAHAEPPMSANSTDVHLQLSDGSKEYYHAENGWQSGDGNAEES